MVIKKHVNVHPVYRVADDLFASLYTLGYGDYDYTDRNPIVSSENAFFRVGTHKDYWDEYKLWY